MCDGVGGARIMSINDISEVQSTDDNGRVVALYVKGASCTKTFFRIASAYCKKFDIGPPMKNSRIAYWRKVPMRDGGSRFVNGKRGDRGVFTVTVVDVEEWRA